MSCEFKIYSFIRKDLSLFPWKIHGNRAYRNGHRCHFQEFRLRYRVRDKYTVCPQIHEQMDLLYKYVLQVGLIFSFDPDL